MAKGSLGEKRRSIACRWKMGRVSDEDSRPAMQANDTYGEMRYGLNENGSHLRAT